MDGMWWIDRLSRVASPHTIASPVMPKSPNRPMIQNDYDRSFPRKTKWAMVGIWRWQPLSTARAPFFRSVNETATSWHVVNDQGNEPRDTRTIHALEQAWARRESGCLMSRLLVSTGSFSVREEGKTPNGHAFWIRVRIGCLLLHGFTRSCPRFHSCINKCQRGSLHGLNAQEKVKTCLKKIRI